MNPKTELELSKWIACKISDVDKSFTSRVVSTIELNPEANALVLVSDYSNDKFSEVFADVVNHFHFRQDRILFFKASPEDTATGIYPEVQFKEFFGMEFVDLPVLMLFRGESAQVEFYEQDSVTKDKLVEWLLQRVFADLM